MRPEPALPAALFAFLLLPGPASGQVERFKPRRGDAIEVWRITHDPAVRDHANYHNTQCWSPDGRYLCFTHFAGRIGEEIHVYDLHRDRDLKIDDGEDPRWANRHNWLFYARRRREDGPLDGKGTHVMWRDVDAKTTTRIGYGVRWLKYTDGDDRWFYGIRRQEGKRPMPVRIRIKEDSPTETLPGTWQVGYNSLMVNPVHPMIVSRDHNYRDYTFSERGSRDPPFVARHFFDHDLAGEKRTTPFPLMEGSHFSWSGDGTWFMAGNGQMRGRKWNEPLPGNIHFLAAMSSGDISPCGRSGRWICGDSGVAQIRVADLRSGDGRIVMETNSFLCFPTGRDLSGPYDIDLKGSPDGTKIAYISTYPQKDGPVARIAGPLRDGRIRVDTTEGFPEKGRLINAAGFGGEVMSYGKKTATTFEGIRRGLYGTDGKARIRTGRPLTSFEAMLVPEKDRRRPPSYFRRVVKDKDSPLLLQRASDLYVAVVRLPDRPLLWMTGEGLRLIPGENHRETFGYHLLRDGKKITKSPLRPGASFDLSGAGTYAAVAVEWSGLESKPGFPVDIFEGTALRILRRIPADFSWTFDRYLVDGRKATKEAAVGAAEAVRETVHRDDGVIHRVWLRRGTLARQHDLNLEGKPIRRLFYEDGRLVRREYHDRNGRHVSTERFAADGSITESVLESSSPRTWRYEKGRPVRYSRGSRTYVPDGDRWRRGKE